MMAVMNNGKQPSRDHNHDLAHEYTRLTLDSPRRVGTIYVHTGADQKHASQKSTQRPTDTVHAKSVQRIVVAGS